MAVKFCLICWTMKMEVSDSETTIELNFAVLKLKHTVKRKNKE